MYVLCCHAPAPAPAATWKSERPSWRRRTSPEKLRGGATFCEPSPRHVTHTPDHCSLARSRQRESNSSKVFFFLNPSLTSFCYRRSWQAESVDSGCSNSMAFTGACSEGLCVEGVCVAGGGGRCDRTTGKLSTVKVIQTRRTNMTTQRKL